MALGLTQTLTERSKGGRYVRLTLSHSRANCLEIWEPQPAERPVQACNWIALSLYSPLTLKRYDLLRWTPINRLIGLVTRLFPK